MDFKVNPSVLSMPVRYPNYGSKLIKRRGSSIDPWGTPKYIEDTDEGGPNYQLMYLI